VRNPLARRNVGFGRFATRRQGPRRETIWIAITEGIDTLTVANSAVLAAVASAAVLAFRPFTIMRTRLFWSVGSDQAVATEDYQVALGAAVVSDQAVAIGVTAVPTPFTDLSSDLWFLHEITTGRILVDTNVGFEGNGVMGREIDSKGMRKVEEGNQPIFTLENSSIAAGSRSLFAGRMLLKLH